MGLGNYVEISIILRLRYMSLVMKIIHMLLITSFCCASVNAAECQVELPIDSAKKAWCKASDILKAQSCLSKFGFERKAIEHKHHWNLSVNDLAPNSEPSCSPVQLIICKSNGKITFQGNGESCAI